MLDKFVDKGACFGARRRANMWSSRRGSWLVRDHINDRRGSFGIFHARKSQKAHWPDAKRHAKYAIERPDAAASTHPTARHRSQTMAPHTTIPKSTRL